MPFKSQTSRSPALEFIPKITTKSYRAVFEVYLNFTTREMFSRTTSHVLVQWDVVQKRVAVWIGLLGCFVNSTAYDHRHSCENTCYTCSIFQFQCLPIFLTPIYYLSSAVFILRVQLTERCGKAEVTWEIPAQISTRRPVLPKSPPPPRPFQTNTGLVLQIRLQELLSTSFAIHYSLIIVIFDAISS